VNARAARPSTARRRHAAQKGNTVEQSAKLAGFFAAHGIWCVSEGGPLVPMLAFERPDGERKMIRLVADQLEVGVERGRQWLAENPEGATRAVLVIDAYVNLPSGKTDALLIEAVRFTPDHCSFTMAVPYRNCENPAGFAVYRPKFVDASGFELDASQLAQAFFLGVDAHEKGAEVWNSHIDESQ